MGMGMGMGGMGGMGAAAAAVGLEGDIAERPHGEIRLEVREGGKEGGREGEEQPSALHGLTFVSFLAPLHKFMVLIAVALDNQCTFGSRQAGRQAGRQASRKARTHARRQAGRQQTGRHAGRQGVGQAGRQAVRWSAPFVSDIIIFHPLACECPCFFSLDRQHALITCLPVELTGASQWVPPPHPRTDLTSPHLTSPLPSSHPLSQTVFLFV